MLRSPQRRIPNTRRRAAFGGSTIAALWRVLLLLAFFLPSPVLAQNGFTTVTGTITDPNGVKWSCGTISAQLITAGGAAPTLNGGGFTTQTSPVQLGCPTIPGSGPNGSFAMRLADSGVISPSNTTWKFTVNTTGNAPPLGTGPQSFSYTSAINCSTNTPSTCTSNQLDISSQLSALAPALGGASSGTPVPGVFNSNFDPPLFQNYTLTTTGAQTGLNLTANPIDTHTISWRPSGTVSTCTVALDTSPDNTTWTAGGAINGQPCTSAGQASAAVNANYVRVNLTTLTGGGTLTVVYSGRLAPPPQVLTTPAPVLTAQTGPILTHSFDTFTRANATTLGTNWLNATLFQIASNTAEPIATGGLEYGEFLFPPNGAWPQDQCASLTLAAHANNNVYGAPGVRMLHNTQGNGSPQAEGYFFGAFNGSGTATLFRILGGGASNLGTGAAITVGHTYTVCASGQPVPLGSGVTITGYDNGSLAVTAADTASTASAGGLYGMLLFATTAVTDVQVTNWFGGGYVNAPTLVNAGGATVIVVPSGVNTTVGSITASGQAVQFVVNQPTQRGIGRLQMIVSPGAAASKNSTSAAIWTLVGSQDGGLSWFNVPATGIPTGSNMGGQGGSLYAQWYDISGMSGSTVYQFILVSGTVNGTLSVIATMG